MREPELPPDELQRLDALRALGILDTGAEERFDRLTRLARRLFDVPIALVSLVDEDRQWFKSCVGLDVRETSRDVSFCGHAILDASVFVVSDTDRDERFRDNPLVLGEPRIRSYAGCPLKVSDGNLVGTLCVIDREPRTFCDDDLAALRDLAAMAEQEFHSMRLATMDDLSGLSNRRGFTALSTQALSMCRRVHSPACLLYFDLDGFKEINDRCGHAEGDRALATFARVLKTSFRDSDVVGRIGGDEFAVLATDTDPMRLRPMLDNLKDRLAACNDEAVTGCPLRFSVGQVQYDAERHADFDVLVAEADAAMFADKQSTRRAVEAA